MSENAVSAAGTLPATKKTERKVKAGALASYVAAAVGLAVLSTSATDLIDGWPDWVEVLVYPLVPAALSWLTGYVTKNRPGYLSPSTVAAATRWAQGKLAH